jgi:cell division protein FtsZ
MPKSLIESALVGAAPVVEGSDSSSDVGRGQRTTEEIEIEKVANDLSVCIKLVGCGGAGSNTVNRCIEDKLEGVSTLALNTDAKHLLSVKAGKKILVGKTLTHGLGAGARPEVGERATMENAQDIKSYLQEAQIVFVTAGMGGGTGTSSSFVTARLAKELGALTIGIVTMPFKSEGELRMENAVQGLSRLSKVCDTTIVIPNDTLIELVPRLPVQAAFKVADELLLQTIRGLTEMLTRAGLVNVDYADLKTILNEGGVSLIGVGESDITSGDRMDEAVEEAVDSPLLGKLDLGDARGALIRVVGGPDMTIEEGARAAEIVTQRVRNDARVIWGCSVEEEMEKRVRVLLIATGARSQYVLLREGPDPVMAPATQDYRGRMNLPPQLSNDDDDLSVFVR